jgi:hypothetical protein
LDNIPEFIIKKPIETLNYGNLKAPRVQESAANLKLKFLGIFLAASNLMITIDLFDDDVHIFLVLNIRV